MPDTVRDYFARLPPDWELPRGGKLFEGPHGIYTIVAARRIGSWNDLRDSLGSVRWELSIIDPAGYVETYPAASISANRWIMMDDGYSSQYG